MSEARFTGRSAEQVQAELAEARRDDLRWSDPRNLRASYFAGDDVVRVATGAFTSYFGANALYGAVAYPSLRRLEAEVIEFLHHLLHAPAGAGGTITTGGTESIFLAVKTARDWAREHKPAARSPTIVVARTTHAAFDKAAELLGLRVRRMERSVDFRADLDAMAAAIDGDTIMIVGSAPPYAYGVVDPLPEIAALAERHGLWMHVDGCVGGMVLPFVRDLGHPVPTFDFELPAVTSMSVDLHKYGYALHGCSALLLRDRELERHQRWQFDRWPVGLYSTAGFAGSRSGGPLASAWAVIRYLGLEGYRARVARMLEAKARLLAGIAGIDGLETFGRPEGTLFSFGSPALDIGLIGQEMNRRGWTFARQTDPAGMLLLLNGFHHAIVPEFLADLEAAVGAVRAGAVRLEERTAVYTV